MLAADLNRADIIEAIRRYGRHGQSDLGYSEGRNVRYWVIWQDKRYPSKLILGMALGVRKSVGGLNGGVYPGSAARTLFFKGFEIWDERLGRHLSS